VLKFDATFRINHGDCQIARFKEITAGYAAAKREPVSLNSTAERLLGGHQSSL